MLIGQKSGRTVEICSSFRDGWQLGPAVAAQGPLSAAAGAVFRPPRSGISSRLCGNVTMPCEEID